MEKSDAWLLTENLHLQRGQADPFSAAIRSSRMSMVVTDPAQPDNPIVFANDAFLRMTGYSREEVLGRNCRFLQGTETSLETVSDIRQAVSKSEDIAVDILNYRKDGSVFWNSLYLSPVLDAAGVAQYFFASQFDVTERKIHEFNSAALKVNLEKLVASRTQDLNEALHKSKLLLHEVDHRVKNNLQMISAMLMLQSMSIPDERIKNTLREMLERVEAMGLVHKRLYQSENVIDFDLSEFTKEIASNLVAATGRDDIALTVDVETVNIKADDAASMALVINETITNALKHAFLPGKKGDLFVSVKPAAGACEISIRDDGPGMPEAGKLKKNFGNTLIETLIKQLRAKIEWIPAKPGTLVKITMPITS
jgi:PAS domain S-box-containing protein